MMHRGSTLQLDGQQRRRTLLSHATLLRGCAPTELDALAREVSVQVRDAASVLLAPDTPATAVSFIAYGRVRLTLFGDGGRQVTVGELGRGDFFGEAAILDGGAHATGAVAAEEVLLLVLPRAPLLEHLQAHPASALRFALEVTRRLTAANQLLAELALDSVEVRVARLVERLAACDGEAVVGGGVRIRRRITHQELAHLVGSSRETVTRTLSALAGRGIITASGRHLVWLGR